MMFVVRCKDLGEKSRKIVFAVVRRSNGWLKSVVFELSQRMSQLMVSYGVLSTDDDEERTVPKFMRPW